MKIAQSIVLAAIFVSLMNLPGNAAGLNQRDLSNNNPIDRVLYVPHAAIDALSSQLLLISNSWRDLNQHLRKFGIDGTPVEDFSLQRYESCCEIVPLLVAVDSGGNIYTLEVASQLGGFNLYKHTSDGELVIDWGKDSYVNRYGFTVEREDQEDHTGEGYEGGETTLGLVTSGGRLQYTFGDPREILPQSDGSLLVMDTSERYVFKVSQDGRDVTEFMGKSDYYPVSPQRLVQDSVGYLYMVDYFDYNDPYRSGMLGVFKFTPDGKYIDGWGDEIGSINDAWRPSIDLTTLVIDGPGNLIVLGGEGEEWTHSEVFTFDPDSGVQTLRSQLNNLTPYDIDYLGILGRRDGGFIKLERQDFTVKLNYYKIDGIREKQVRIENLYGVY